MAFEPELDGVTNDATTATGAPARAVVRKARIISAGESPWPVALEIGRRPRRHPECEKARLRDTLLKRGLRRLGL